MEDALLRFAAVWLLPAAIVVLPFGVAEHLDATGWIGMLAATFAAFVIHDTMRHLNTEMDAVEVEDDPAG